MNAYELADQVEMWGEDLLALNMKGGIPVVQGAKMLRQQADLIRNLQKSLGFKNSGYEISFVPQEHRSVIHEFYLFPKYKELKNGSYKFNKTDWSIEEMLDMLATVLK